MKVKTFYLNKDGKVEFTEKQLNSLLNEIYDEGHKDGYSIGYNAGYNANRITWTTPYYNYDYNITTSPNKIPVNYTTVTSSTEDTKSYATIKKTNTNNDEPINIGETMNDR